MSSIVREVQFLGGIFVGGAGTRFGGIAKGLLPSPHGSGTILDHLVALLRAANAEVVLVGERVEYMDLGLPVLRDIGDSGPLGGLRALYAQRRRTIVLACDMPFVTTLTPLLESSAPLAAPRRNGMWEPFYSVHDPHIVGPIADRHAAENRLSLQALFDAVPATELPVAASELEDWDTPEDQARTMPMRTMSK